MAQEVTLGGDRIGSGNKQKVELHNYGMTSFNLEQDWKSSMAPGILYPFLKLVGTNHGTFDIDLDSFIRTLPTKGPLFGAFKFQADIYCVPIRLYQGILHNNPIGIGMKMNQVYLPKILFKTIDGNAATTPRVAGSNEYNWQVNESSLMKYLGLSGIGRRAQQLDSGIIQRKINAVPFLAYYDIFKCYYSNKQEENAYVITPGEPTETPQNITTWTLYYENGSITSTIGGEGKTRNYNRLFYKVNANRGSDEIAYFNNAEYNGSNLNDEFIHVTLYVKRDGATETINIDELSEIQEYITYTITENKLEIKNINWNQLIENYGQGTGQDTPLYLDLEFNNVEIKYSADIHLQPFALQNIDDMRNALLSTNTLGSEFIIGDNGNWNNQSGTDGTGLPYSALIKRTEEDITWNAFEDNGLVIKTYQSDLFNNWLNTEYIDGENGISALTAVTVSDGSFTIDSLNLAEKIYEVLNRVAVSGGTYEDWQEAVYGEGAVRKAETPMYIGGMAAEVMFEEVISTAETDITSGEGLQALGSLGGKGTQVGAHGGRNIHVKCEEPCYIIGIASLTPRICYSQGNDWDLTELDTLDDLHKPALDGIGFQDLIVEQMAWWNTVLSPAGPGVIHRSSAGKQTAWINYQTAIDKCFGDFAKTDGKAFMVLNRNYEIGSSIHSVKDLTTYIDPAKFNYAFAYTNLAAQNFWCQIHSKVIARRKMGAQQIPNL